MYIFRAEGNTEIGMGHLMRCLTIADALNNGDKNTDSITGGELPVIWFVCAEEASAELVRRRGYQVAVLGMGNRYSMENPGREDMNLETELELWKSLSFWNHGDDHSKNKNHMLLIDSYFITDAYLQGLKEFGKIAILDDMGQHAYPVDIVINYNAFAREEHYQQLYQEKYSQCYIGSRYTPIRPEFCGTDYRVREKVTDLLITVGGGDRDNIAGKIIRKIYQKNLNYHIITGKFNPHYEHLKDWAKQHPGVSVYHDVVEIVKIMQQCDLAITAGGTTVYELAALGVPFICFSCAENQEALAAHIGIKEIAGYAGCFHKEPVDVLKKIDAWCREMEMDNGKRDSYYLKQKNMIDGKGAVRVAEILRTNHRAK